MPRAKRILYPNAWYHVFNRGNARKTVFFSDYDYEVFLHYLQYVHDEFQAEIHSFCLMKNHYHLLIKTPRGNLSEIMHSLGTHFVKTVNQSLNSDGSLFRGRYRSILIDSDRYLLQLSRYIHLNPVTAGYVKKPGLYQWSSFSSFIKKKSDFDFLSRESILAYFKSPSEYRSYVGLGIDQEIRNYYKDLSPPTILGSEDFIDKVKSL